MAQEVNGTVFFMNNFNSNQMAFHIFMSGKSIFVQVGKECRRRKGIGGQKDSESERDSKKYIFLWSLSKSYKTERI